MNIIDLWKEKSEKCSNLKGAVGAHCIDGDINFEILSINQPQQFNINTKFQAASLSKLVGAIVCAKFFENHYKFLDLPLKDKLQIPVAEKTTLKHIFSHSAGINVPGFPGYEKTPIPNITQIIHGQGNTQTIRQSLSFGKYAYSGGGYCLAQEYIERISKIQINNLAKELLFEPLNLHSTTFDILLKDDNSCAIGYDKNGRKIRHGWHLYPETIAAGLWTTPCEYLKILNELIKGYYGKSSIISEIVAREILTPFVDCEEDGHIFKYALGVRISQNIYWHSGSNKGYKSLFAFDLDSKKGFVIMSDDDNAENILTI